MPQHKAQINGGTVIECESPSLIVSSQILFSLFLLMADIRDGYPR